MTSLLASVSAIHWGNPSLIKWESASHEETQPPHRDGLPYLVSHSSVSRVENWGGLVSFSLHWGVPKSQSSKPNSSPLEHKHSPVSLSGPFTLVGCPGDMPDPMSNPKTSLVGAGLSSTAESWSKYSAFIAISYYFLMEVLKVCPDILLTSLEERSCLLRIQI